MAFLRSIYVLLIALGFQVAQCSDKHHIANSDYLCLNIFVVVVEPHKYKMMKYKGGIT